MTDCRRPPATRREAGEVRPGSARHVVLRHVRVARLHRLLLGVYLYSRAQTRGLFLQSQAHLDLRSGSSTRSSC